MRTFSQFQLDASAHWFLGTLLVAVVTSLVALGAALLARRFARNSRTESTILVAAMIVILASPSLPWVAQKLSHQAPRELASINANSAAKKSSTVSEVSGQKTDTNILPLPDSQSQVAGQVSAEQAIAAPIKIEGAWLWLTWLSLSGLIGVLALFRLARAHQKLRDWPDHQSQELQDIVSLESARLGLNSVKLVDCKECTPCVSIWPPYTLALSPGVQALSQEEQRAIVLHELYHIKLCHGAQKSLSILLACLYGWVPGVRSLCTRLEEAQDLECDQFVASDLGDGKPLAKALLWFAEKSITSNKLQGTLSLFRKSSALAQRVLQLSQVRRNNMIHKLPKGVGIATIILCAASAVTSIHSLHMVPAQQSAHAAMQEYFPFREGSQWRYKVAAYDGEKREEIWTAWSLKRNQATPIMEFRNEIINPKRPQRPQIEYAYFAWNKLGLTEVQRNSLMSDVPGHISPSSSSFFLPIEPKVGQTWTWKEPWRGQTMIGPDGVAPPPAPDDEMTGKVVATDRSIQVAGKSVESVVVDISKEAVWGTSTTRYWFVKGIGIVKAEWFDDKGKVLASRELIEYKPGPELPPIEPQVEARAREIFPLESSSREIFQIRSADVDGQLRSRFSYVEGTVPSVVNPQNSGLIPPASRVRHIIRMIEGKATRFDPLEGVDLVQLWKDEKLIPHQETTAMVPSIAGQRWANPVGHLIAIQNAMKLEDVNVLTQVQQVAEGIMETKVTISDKTQRGIYSVRTKGAKIVSIDMKWVSPD